MTLRLPIRPVLACAAAAALSACGMVDADPHRFESLADNVAAIPVGESRLTSHDAPAVETAAVDANKPLTVEVMDPHALWDARDGIVRASVEQAAPAAEAVVRQASARLTPAVARRPTVAEPAEGAAKVVQIGAYSSEAAARAAWSKLQHGDAAWAVGGSAPVFETVEVGGRELTRLKVRVPGAGAAAVCAAAGVDDPWCHRDA